MERTINFSNLAENSAILATPIIKDGVVYIGACETYFYALDLYDGHRIWSYKTDGIISGTAVFHDDALYFGSFDTHLYALSKEGNLLWKFKTGGIVAGGPAIHNNILYFGSCDNYFYAVSLETREVLWKFRTGDEVIGTPLIDGDRIYFGSQDGYLYCTDLGGNLIWKFRTGGSITLGAPAATGDLIFFASSDQNLYAVDRDGNFKWGFRTGDIVFNRPFVFDNFVCFGSRDMYFYVLDQKTGVLKWKFCANDRVVCKPVLYQAMIVFGANKIFALGRNGSVVWTHPLSPYYQCNGLAVEDGVLVFGSEIGYIHALNAGTGQPIWKFRTKSSAIISPKGVLPPPKYDKTLFERLSGMAQEIKKERTPGYLLTTLPDSLGIEGKDRKEYIIGVPEQNTYKALGQGDYVGTDREKKRRQKELEMIERQFRLGP